MLHGLLVGGVPVPSESDDPALIVELDVQLDAAGGQVVGQQAVVRGATHHHLDNDFLSSILPSVSAQLTSPSCNGLGSVESQVQHISLDRICSKYTANYLTIIQTNC